MLEGNQESSPPLAKVLTPNNPEESLGFIYEKIGRDNLSPEKKSEWVQTCNFVNEIYQLVFKEIQKKEVEVNVLKKRMIHILLSRKLMYLDFNLQSGDKVDFSSFFDEFIEQNRPGSSIKDHSANVKAGENLSELIILDLVSPKPNFNKMMLAYFSSFHDPMKIRMSLEMEINLIYSRNIPEMTDENKSSLVVDEPKKLPNSKTDVVKIHFSGKNFKGGHSVRKLIEDLQAGRESVDLYKRIITIDIVGISWLLSRVRPLLLDNIGLRDIEIFTDIEPEEISIWKDDNPILKLVTREEILEQSIGALELSQRAMQRYLRYGLLPEIGVTYLPNKVFFEPLYEKRAKKEEIYCLAAKYSHPYSDFEDAKATIVASMKGEPSLSEVGYLIKAIDVVFPADMLEEEVPQWVWEWRALLLNVEVKSLINHEKRLLAQEAE